MAETLKYVDVAQAVSGENSIKIFYDIYQKFQNYWALNIGEMKFYVRFELCAQQPGVINKFALKYIISLEAEEKNKQMLDGLKNMLEQTYPMYNFDVRIQYVNFSTVNDI